MVRFSFCGVELRALPQGALFWPDRRALLVADLHLEKASWFARLGQMLPPYDSIATLAASGATAAMSMRSWRAQSKRRSATARLSSALKARPAPRFFTAASCSTADAMVRTRGPR